MSHVPGGLCYKKLRNIIRPANGGNPTPPLYTLTWFYGHNLPDPPETVMGAALAARQEFESYIDPGFDVQTYESFIAGDQMFDASFMLNGITVSMPMPTNGGIPLYDPEISGVIFDVNSLLGRYNTTTSGANYVNQLQTEDDGYPDPLGYTRFEFAPAVNWFGVYLTDIGDFDGSIKIRITAEDLTTADYTLDTFGLEGNGFLTFIGFIDLSKAYTKAEFLCTNPAAEVFGVDDLTCGPGSMINP